MVRLDTINTISGRTATHFATVPHLDNITFDAFTSSKFFVILSVHMINSLPTLFSSSREHQKSTTFDPPRP
jgi:hypothetical protein